MTNPLRIFLGDLCNNHDHSSPTPLNIGYVGSYILDRIPGIQIELFKHPVQMVKRIKEDPPDVIGLSHYFWNSNLNIKILKIAKSLKPETVTIYGGPNFNSVDQDIVANPIVNFHIVREGEESFRLLLESLIGNNLVVDSGIVESLPSTIFVFDRDSCNLINNPLLPMDRLDLSQLTSPYLSGLMDPFLEDDRLAPIIETNRGCPYSCSFCAWGSAILSKVRQFPLEQVIEEIKYVVQRSKNLERLLYLADANFGILKRDEEIAKLIRTCSTEHNFPKKNYVYFAKNTNDKVIKIAEIMKDISSMSMSMQSTNDDVLANIKRKNIPYHQYDTLRLECEKRGVRSFTELIYGLPGETYESFINGAIEVVDRADNLHLYPLLLIEGSENNTKADREKFDIKSKYRVSAQHVSTVASLRTIEYEEVAVENYALSFDEWLRLREFHFLMTLLASKVFSDFRRELKTHALNYAVFAKRILEDQENAPPEWSKMLGAFRQSAIEELLDPDQAKEEFALEDLSNIEFKYPALNPYYFSLLICDSKLIKALHAYLSDGMMRILQTDLTEYQLTGLKMALNLSFDCFICYEDFKLKKKVKYKLDLNAWISDYQRRSITDYQTKVENVYEFSADPSIGPQLSGLLSNELKLYEAVYKMRMGRLDILASNDFCYNRKEAQDR